MNFLTEKMETIQNPFLFFVLFQSEFKIKKSWIENIF